MRKWIKPEVSRRYPVKLKPSRSEGLLLARPSIKLDFALSQILCVEMIGEYSRQSMANSILGS